MLLKWKCILTNWINCYCNERDTKDLDINLDSLLIIISHLRRNLSLDDSRSSLLEAHNIHEFILEKYPDFKFENGTCDPHSEEDLHLSASLLLFFVCVNSKNIDLKNAMCSKLSSSDQEIIMKFSKCLMGCTNITSSDVLQAITEACGQDIAGAETVTTTVAETPPALRSLHSEVRRLQAALDAERFDRNYLQEELSRTNLKLEKLTKVKEQYKQEIVNLKARVSDSCSEDYSTAGSEASHNNSVKLAKQLEQAEERLAHLQEELSNVEYERNGYKNKLDELKRDRDKYFALSQQENIRASQLAEELDTERRQCNSLRELVTELRQHNRLNRMDSSQLECDDLDTSVHSLQHNSSVCSEVCASIIEVQLAEERSKITTLKNQMQMLQDQLTELNNKYEKEKIDLGKTLSEKECDIMNLKHRINEEIESKNVIKSKCDNDITKLNNEVNELEQTLKDTTENARKTIDAKMQEIQTLQEEKLSLLQSFSNETSKLESKVQELKKEIESEKTSKQKMREDYDNHIMKLNEKVLNRNNELVEFQNKIVTKGEEIESLQIQLRNEKDMRQELINKHNNDVLHYNNVIREQNLNVQKSSEEIAELRKQVQQYYECIEEMNRERNNLNASLLGLKEEVKILTSEKQIWLKEKEKLANEFDEKNETINSLKSQLQTEIQFKNETQSKLREVESHIQILLEEKNTLTNKLSSVIAENSNACEKLKEEVKDLTSGKQILLKEKEKLEKEFEQNTVIISSLESQLQTEIQFKNEIQSKLREVESEKEILTVEKSSLTNKLSKTISENSDACQMLEEKVKNLTSEKQIVLKEKEQLQNEFDEKNEIINSLQRQLQTEVKFKNEIQSKLLEVETNKEILCKEKTSLTNKLSTVIAENSNTCEMLKEEIENLTSDKQILLKEKEQLHNEFDKKNEEIQSLERQLQTEIQFKNEIQSKLCQVESEKELLHKELTSLTNEMSTVIAQNSDACEKLNLEVKNLTSEKQMLLKEKEQLQNEKEILCEEKTSIKMEFQNLTSEKEMLLKEKEILQNKFDENNNTIYSLENQLQSEIQLKHEIQSKLSDVVSEKEILCEEKNSLKMEIENLTTEKEMLLKEKEILQNKTDENTNTIYSLESQLRTEIQVRNEIQSKLFEVESENEILCEEKTSLTNKMSTVIAKNSDECKKLNELVENLTSEKLILLKEKEQLQNGFDEKNEIINALESQLQTEIKFKNKMQSKLSEVESEKVILQNKFDENNNTIHSLESQLKTEIQLRDEIQSKLSEVESEKEILCEKKTSLQMEKERLLKEKEILQNKIDKNTNTIYSLESQLQTEIQIRNKIQSKLFEVESEKEILCEEKTYLTNKMSTLIAKNSDECKKLNELVENLTSEKLILLKEKEQLQNGFDEKNEIINALESQLQTEIQFKNKMQSKLREVETDKEILTEEKNSLTNKLSKVISENSDTCQMLEEKVKNLASEKQIVLKEKEQLQNEFDEKNEIINSLQRQLQTEVKFKNEIHSKLCEVESEKEILCEEQTENSNACEMLQEELKKLNSDKQILLKEKEQLQNEFDKRNELLNSLESQLQTEIQLKNEIQSKLRAVETDKEILCEEKTSLSNKLSAVIADNSNIYEMLKEEIMKLTNEKEMWLKETEILQNKFDEQNEIINSLESQLQHEIKLRNKVQSKLCEVDSEKSSLNNKLSTVIADNSNMCEMLKEEIKKLISEKETWLKKAEILQNKFDEQNEIIDSLENQVKNEIKLRNEVQSKLCEVESEKTALNNKMSTVIAKNSDTCEMLKEEVKKLTSKKEMLLKEKEILQNKFEEKNETINSLENQLHKEIQLRNEIHTKLCEVESEKEKLCEEKTSVTNKLFTVISENSEACEKLNQRILQEQQASLSLQNQVDNSNKKIEELLEIVKQKNDEFSKQIEEYKGIIEAKTNEVESLVFKNATLHNELNEVKIQLDSKVHSLKDKLIDNENITDKLKATYESQIDNLNVMVSKLTSYLKEKTIEIEATNKEKAQLEEALKKSNEAISLLEEEVKCQKQKHDKLISEFESERVVLKNIVSVTEDVMEDQKLNFNNKFTEVTKQNEELKDHVKLLEEQIVTERKNAEITLNDKVDILNIALKDLSDIKDVKKSLEEENLTLKELVSKKTEEIELATSEKNSLENILESVKNDKTLLENKMQEFEMLKDNQITDNMNLLKEKENEIMKLKEELERQTEAIKQFETLQEALSKERDEVTEQLNVKDTLLETGKNLRISQLNEIQKLQQLQTENLTLQNIIKEKESEIMAIREHFENEIDQNQQVGDQNKVEQTKLLNKCKILEEYQIKAEEELKHRQAKIEVLVSEMETIRNEFAQVEVEKNIHIEKLETELAETKQNYLRYKQEAEKYSNEIGRLRENLNAVNTNTVYNLKKENELLLKAVTNNENMANNKENIPNYREDVAIKIRELQNQVHDSAFDHTTSSIDSSKTITDLEKIIQDRNRTITTLHSDITYLKTLIAESENKLLDVTKDLDLSRENCHQLSNQLKKVVLQKNEEIAELRNKITKMSATETRASQIIKVSAKYQAMIIKRIAEIKNNTVLKELTNFGNSANTNGENEHRRSFNAGNITMEDLENFLETTDRHLKRCSEKQIALQKERDRLLEINKINDSEIIAMRKFLTELSVSVKTFNSVKDLYSQKLNKVIALQRTVRREILNLDGRINDATMCKLERGYAAIMQDLSECALNLERWVDRSIVRSISPEKIKQAFMSELDRASLVPTNFQNTSLEIQFGELESSFHKLLKEVMQAQSGDGAKDAQALTIMEVRAEYEDKLSRMKTKMKELYVDQISQFQEKHKKVIEEYERKLEKANEETKELSKAYQQHIRSLTTELWNVGEKFIIQKDEAQWLRKQQKSGSLMSLQHVHSTGLAAPHEDAGRPSDTLSLRSLQVHNKNERKGRKTCGDMSDEEGEVFDNRCLRELTETPRRGRPSAVGGAGGGAMKRLSELQRRNTLCQPHLKSSYPAETQFVPGVQEDDIKCNSMSLGGKAQRKEVGITAYKKPGPPTPSKQAGRLSATDSELRESLRVEAEPGARRTATPSRLFGLFRGKQDTIEGTPRGRRLSNIFRKK